MESKEILSVKSQEIQPKSQEMLVDLRPREEELPKGVEAWMTRVEKANPQQVNDAATGAPILTPITPTNPVITIPVKRSVFASGFKKTVSDAGRWLSESIFRLIKIKKGEVKFNEE